jgi:MFS family permease
MSFTSAESRWRDVYLVAGLRAVSVCGDFLAATTLALLLQERGHGGLAVSGLLIAAGLPIAVLGPWAGRLADRADSRLLLVACGLAQATICAGLAFVTAPALIIALVALLACGLAVTQPTLSALVPAMVRPADLPKASGLSQTAGSIGMLLAPALAGVLVGHGGGRLPLLLDAASYLSLVAAGFLIRARRGGSAGSDGGTAGAAATLVRWRLRDDRLLGTMVGVLAAVVAAVGAINVFEVFFVRDTLGGSTTVFGLIAGAWTLGMLAGAMVVARLPHRWMTVPVALALMAGSCAPVLASAAVGNAGSMLPLWFVGGLFNGGINVLVAVVVAGRAPAEARGRAFAVLGAAVQGASLLGVLAAGPLVDRFDPRLLVAAAGAAGLVAVLLCLPVALVRRAAAGRVGAAEEPASHRTGEVRPEPPRAPVSGEAERARDSVEA